MQLSFRWTHVAVIVAMMMAATIAEGQRTEIETELRPDQAAKTVRISIPFPSLGAGIQTQEIHRPLFTTLTSDLAYAEIFTIVPLRPGGPPGIEGAKQVNAQAFLQLDVRKEGGDYAIEARLYDVSTGALHMGRRYRGAQTALPTLAHTIANDLVLFFQGRPGIFLSRVAFISDRTGSNEVWMMDYDGSNQRRITSEGALTLTPDWSPDGERLVYTSYRRRMPELYIIHRQGGGRIRIDTGVGLNTSPAFSPDGRKIAFVGAVDGNPDIYVINDDGTGRRRLTTEASIESTPEWSPTGRQIAFTSSRAGSPQIYVMDAEGANVRRLSFDGNWNDDAAWSPDGEWLAYTSAISGRYQIRLLNMTTGETRVIAGRGSNEQPAWSPDGRALMFMSNRTGRWQLYRIGLHEAEPFQLTTEGNNMSPSWSKQ
jgi:TolB protein